MNNNCNFNKYNPNPNCNVPYNGFQSMVSSGCNNFQGNNFNRNFQNNCTLIDKTNYKNQNNTIHNNLAENLLTEQIVEYYINIDSSDRKLEVFPSPFNFVVSFGGVGQTVERDAKGRQIIFEATPAPIIDRSFRNVKYIKLDYVILPRTLTVKINNISGSDESGKYDYSGTSDSSLPDNKNGCVCLLSNDEENALTKYKFIMLRIKEIASDRILGTNNNISSDTFILYPDKIMGRDHIMWLSTWSNRIYKTSLLANIDRLTIELLDPEGNILQVYDHEGNVINVNKDKRIENIKNQLQINIAMIFGVLENDMATNPKFEY